MKKYFIWSCLVFFSALKLGGVELKPWYPRDLQVLGIIGDRFQSYSSVDAPHKNHYSSQDHFVEGSLMTIYSPYSLQLNAIFADTRKRNFDWDHVGLTGRYLWKDDNLGDPFSLATGLTLSRAWREAVNDISSFHHGRNEAFLHVAFGKQKIEGALWLSRWWGVVGIGTADRWTPWVVANLAYEKSFCDPHQICLYLNTLWGCGKHKLNVKDFGGYGPIAHRSLDLGLRYTYEFDYWGQLSVEYAHRLYAHNFPDHTNTVTLYYIYPFGPEADFYLLKAYSLFSGKITPF